MSPEPDAAPTLAGAPPPPARPPGPDPRLTAGPIAHDPDWGMWFVTRYADCADALRDPRLGREAGKVGGAGRLAAESVRGLAGLQRDWLLLRDPPDHTRIKRGILPGFTPTAVERFRPFVSGLVRDALDRFPAEGDTDLVARFAVPVVLGTMGRVLGLPPADQPELARLCNGLSQAGMGASADSYALAERCAGELRRYFEPRARRASLASDLLARPAAGRSRGMSESELVATCVLLLLGGYDTTASLLGNALYSLWRHPAQVELLGRRPDLVGAAVDEAMRYAPPIQVVVRVALAEVQMAGVRLRPGSWVGLHLGAANRDPAVFARPDLFDATRVGPRHLGLGGGIHYCPGGALARLVAVAGIGALVRRRPDLLTGAAAVRWRPSFSLLGAEEFVVRPHRAGDRAGRGRR